MAGIIATVKSVPVVGKFVSGIFKKSTYREGYGRFCEIYSGKVWCNVLFGEFFTGLPCRMTAKRASDCRKHVLSITQNWQKRMKKDIATALSKIIVVPDPPPPAPPEVHTVSASSLQLGQTAVIKKSGEVIQAGISKIPIYVFVGIGALLILPQLLRTRGGRE